MQKLYYIRTYGCQMNIHESEKLAGVLKVMGYSETTDINVADIIIFNTCCIRDSAEQKVLGNIGAVKKLKENNPNLIFAVCGCMTQEDGRADLLKQKYPHVSIVFGTHNLHKFKDYLEQYSTTKKRVYDIWEKEVEINEDVEMHRTSNNNAWVNIMYGCNNFCTYCIVPFVRGRERSRNLDDIVNEVTKLSQEGYKYVTLLGQNVNSYGNDFDNEINFAYLLQKLCQIPGDFKIKFMTSHPKDLTNEVIDVIANNDKLSKSIHLPVQSGSNKILKLMNRVYTIEHYKKVVETIKSKIPNCYLSTDIIVGFPYESEEDFNQTYELIKEIGFGGIFAYMYSQRTGTVAEKMPEQIDKILKNQRVNTLLALSREMIKEQNKQLINSIQDALIEGKTDTGYIGVLDSGKNIIIKTDKELVLPQFAKVKLLSLTRNKFNVELID